jgi:hypothetical protein
MPSYYLVYNGVVGNKKLPGFTFIDLNEINELPDGPHKVIMYIPPVAPQTDMFDNSVEFPTINLIIFSEQSINGKYTKQVFKFSVTMKNNTFQYSGMHINSALDCQHIWESIFHMVMPLFSWGNNMSLLDCMKSVCSGFILLALMPFTQENVNRFASSIPLNHP